MPDPLIRLTAALADRYSRTLGAYPANAAVLLETGVNREPPLWWAVAFIPDLEPQAPRPLG